MCGIAGILRVWPAEQRAGALATPPCVAIPERWLDVLDESIRHRGPDGCGRFRDRAVRADGSVVDVALVHRRLSIIDHAGGHQPMVWEGVEGGTATGTPPRRAGRLLTPAELEAHNRRLGAEGSLGAGGSETPGSESRGTQTQLRRVAVVFNGCIYNHRELRAELQRGGYEFSTDHSDTEVLVHGWDRWGRDLPEWLEGMFAFAVWDRARAELFTARDRFGEKPLRYRVVTETGSTGQFGGMTIVFGSTAAAVASVPIPFPDLRNLCESLREPQGRTLVESLVVDQVLLLSRGYSGWPARSLPGLSDLRALEPGERAAFGAGAATPVGLRWGDDESRWVRSAYWERPSRRLIPLGPDDTDDLLERSVGERLDADVPLACFLSGGVDSSLIAHYAKRRLGRLTTLCVRMPDARYDESRFAEAVARHLGTDHVTVECPTGGADDLVRLVQQMGLPLGDSSLLPTHWVSRAASEHVRVALSGDGGDELFLGYERYRAASLLKRWHRLIAIVPPGLFSDADPKSRAAKIRRFVSAARCGSPYLSAAFGGPELRELIGPAQFDAIIARNDYVARRWFDDDPASSDTRTYLPDDLLIKVDSASMACGLEVRAPMLATALGEAALGATLLSLMPHGQRKGLLRQVARRYLPAEIVDRPKMGFAIPIGEWFRSDYGGLRTMLLDHLNSAEPFGPPSLGIELNMRYVRQMLDEHLGTGPGGRVVRDHSQRLYMLLVLSIWAKWVGSLGRG